MDDQDIGRKGASNSDQSEKQVTADCIGWLRSHGWICRRQHVIHPAFNAQGVCIGKVGEEGECDWRCVRSKGSGYIEYFEIELKRPGKMPQPKQREYMAKRNHQGLPAFKADSLEELKKWYRERGYAA